MKDLTPAIDFIHIQLMRLEKDYDIQESSRINYVWHDALDYWHDVFDHLAQSTASGQVIEREDLQGCITWAKEESMKAFAVDKKFRDPESLWFFEACTKILEPYAWRLARLERKTRKPSLKIELGDQRKLFR